MTAPSPLLLLLLVPLIAAAPAFAATLAVSSAGTTTVVCGVAELNGTLLCASGAGAPAYPVAPFLAFAEVSAGRGFACGLTAGGGALFCWPSTAPGRLRRLHNGGPSNALADLAVGADGHVAAYDRTARRVLWWRGGGRFPAKPVAGAFRSLVSGDGFSCAVETTGTGSSSGAVRCWGPRGSDVQAAFSSSSTGGGATYSYLAAGGTRACGVEDGSGAVRCSNSSSSTTAVVPRDVFPYGMAVGEAHACGLLRPNHTAVCWTLGGPTATLYYPAFGTSFEFLVAGGNLTCGVVSADFTVLCWSASDADRIESTPLRGILPGVCVAEPSTCDCGFLPQSAQLCAGSGGGVICNRLCTPSPPPVSVSSPPPAWSPPPSSSSDNNGVRKRWIAFVVVGAVGSFAGLCSVAYCLVFGFCSNKIRRVHSSVQPTSIISNNAGGPSSYGSPNASRALGALRRQLSRAVTRQRSGPSTSFKDPAAAVEFSFAQLEAATDGFAPEAKIGAGNFGTVYRGKLPDGREVAVKRAAGDSSGAGPSRARGRVFQDKDSAFRLELSLLSRLHHKHLVGLVGYCDDNEERLLVYEYMNNGALYDHLHDNTTAGTTLVLSWKLRIKILLDAARGIDYLHSYAVPPIIHRDIKSSNILLDSAWTARVSDFGLSLSGPDAAQGTDDRTKAAAGTLGYMDPEYYGLRRLTPKSDVYGFGVVMLEVLTGKRAIFKEDSTGTPVSVVDRAVPAIVAGEVRGVLDARAPETAPHEAEAVELVAHMAVHCVRLEGKDRPAMADVVANLETAFALCEGSAGNPRGGGGGFGNSSSSASLSFTSMDRSGALV